MLLGVEKKLKEEEELEARFSLRSDPPEIEDRREFLRFSVFEMNSGLNLLFFERKKVNFGRC